MYGRRECVQVGTGVRATSTGRPAAPGNQHEWECACNPSAETYMGYPTPEVWHTPILMRGCMGVCMWVC